MVTTSTTTDCNNLLFLNYNINNNNNNETDWKPSLQHAQGRDCNANSFGNIQQAQNQS